MNATATAATYEAVYDKLAPTITRLSDAALVESIHEAKAQKVSKFIVFALVAEATFRGIKLA